MPRINTRDGDRRSPVHPGTTAQSPVGRCHPAADGIGLAGVRRAAPHPAGRRPRGSGSSAPARHVRTGPNPRTRSRWNRRSSTRSTSESSGAGPHYRKVINATGIILHTALGRAVLPASGDPADSRGIVRLLVGPDGRGHGETLEAGRADRVAVAAALTGAEAATVVNNNAAATVVVLNTAAAGREVIVSRGQLVEIGGSFRLPDVMAVAGVKLVEVGTTNKTHLRDYEQAITGTRPPSCESTRATTRSAGSRPRCRLHRWSSWDTPRAGVIDDVGAGPLVDFSQFGFQPEPTLPESVRDRRRSDHQQRRQTDRRTAGRDHSGPRPLIQAVRKNPLVRILRPGKLTWPRWKPP
jgi:L-seryl-tRNA(Ser) seleniumtransferase